MEIIKWKFMYYLKHEQECFISTHCEYFKSLKNEPRARHHGVQSGIFVLPQSINNFVYLFDFKWFNSQKERGKMFILYQFNFIRVRITRLLKTCL
jgi:hypothetical protein